MFYQLHSNWNQLTYKVKLSSTYDEFKKDNKFVMNKELKPLEKLKLYWNNELPLSCSQGLKIVSILEKRDKALEIIKRKNVDVGVLRVCTSVYAYEDTLDLGYQYKTFAREKLTKEEFDLLKEVL